MTTIEQFWKGLNGAQNGDDVVQSDIYHQHYEISLWNKVVLSILPFICWEVSESINWEVALNTLNNQHVGDSPISFDMF